MNVYGGSGEAARGTWATPQDVFDSISKLYGPFDLDAAASEQNTKCRAYIDEERDAFRTEWTARRVWCNPPYRDPGRWLARAHRQLARGNCQRVVLLLPASVGTEWFNSWVSRARYARVDQVSFRSLCVRPESVQWRVHFWPKRIQFVPPAGVKATSNPRGIVLFIGDSYA